MADEKPILGASPEEARIASVMMVGAEYGTENGLSHNDSLILTMFLRHLAYFKIPYDDKFTPFDNLSVPGHPAPVEVVNRLSEYGGRDFFHENGNPDVIILCNIPENPPSTESDWQANNDLTGLERYRLRKSFSVSATHAAEDWRKKVSELAPKMVAIFGHDTFSPESLRAEGYISIRDPKTYTCFLFSRDYLENIEAYLIASRSMLHDCVVSEEENFAIVEEYPKREGRADFLQRPIYKMRGIHKG